jgi:transketolase
MRTYETLLGELAEIDPRVVVLTAENRAAIRSLPALLGDRFVDTGIAEQTLIGVSAGLALRGRIPVAHALASFLTMRPFEFIRTDVGIPGLPVKLVGSVPGFLSEANGPTHQALEDVALMRGIPGMRVFAPADEEDLLLGLPHVLADSAPWYVRFNARRPVVSHAPFSLGRAEVISEGHHVAILTYGVLFEQAVEAARLLTEDGISVTLLNMRTLEPFDEEAVLAAVRSTGFLVTLEDHFERGGLYSIVCELLVRRRLSPDVVPFALSARWFEPGLFDDVHRAEGFRGDQIAARVRRSLSVRNRRTP